MHSLKLKKKKKPHAILSQKSIHNTKEPSWMENKGTIPGKGCLRERVGLYFPFSTRNCGPSTTTRDEKPNAIMDRVKVSRVV
jgi:hypothetical protein